MEMCTCYLLENQFLKEDKACVCVCVHMCAYVCVCVTYERGDCRDRTTLNQKCHASAH